MTVDRKFRFKDIKEYQYPIEKVKKENKKEYKNYHGLGYIKINGQKSGKINEFKKVLENEEIKFPNKDEISREIQNQIIARYQEDLRNI